METSDLKELRKRLERERDAVGNQLAEYNATVGRGEEAPNLEGFADSAHSTTERSEVISMIDELEAAKSAVDAALIRMDEGTYGKCERCGKDIPLERLEAIPTAALCVTCKQQERG